MSFLAEDFDFYSKNIKILNKKEFLAILEEELKNNDRIEIIFKYGYNNIDYELYKFKVTANDMSRYSQNTNLMRYINSISCDKCKTYKDAVNNYHPLCYTSWPRYGNGKIESFVIMQH
jgi:hypothetical protein